MIHPQSQQLDSALGNTSSTITIGGALFPKPADPCGCNRYCPCCGRPRSYEPPPYYCPPQPYWWNGPPVYTSAASPSGAISNNTYH